MGVDDPVARARRASAQDRDERYYARKRALQARRRAEQDRRTFDPAPPDDADWTVAQETNDGLQRVRPPEAVGSTLDELIRRRGWSEALRSTAVWTHWTEIVGSQLAARCEPVRLSAGVLTIRAESQPWATQLRYLTTPLRHKCDEILGEGMVRDVAIVVGELERATPRAGEGTKGGSIEPDGGSDARR